MKANEFIKKFGWEVAGTDLRNHEKYGTRSILYIHDDLKRYVDAYELVQSYGGLYAARKEAHKNCFEYDVELLKAITLVEECQ